MSNRVRRLQILSLCGLIIFTAGITAAPVRQLWVPLVGQQFGQWLDADPAAAPTMANTTAAARAEEFPGPDLSSTRTVARPSAANAAADAISPDERAEHGPSGAWSEDSGSRRSDDAGGTTVFAYGGGRTYVGGSSGGGFGGGGGAVGGADRSGVASGSSTVSTEGSGRSNPPASSSPAPGHAGGSSGGAPEPNAPSAPPAAPPAAIDAPIGSGIPGLFAEHEAGLDHLTGAANDGLPFDGADVGAAGVAVNPEPSTLFLFGTGLAVAAGALRRRMRR